MLKNTLTNERLATSGSARPRLTVINSPASADPADKVSLAAIVDKFTELGVKDILVVDGKKVDVHKIK